MELSLFLPVFFILTEVLSPLCSDAQDSGRGGRRSGSLLGRRGEMDKDFDIDDLSVLVDRRVPGDNRTPGHRDMALASLEILVAGERTRAPTTPKSKSDLETRRPLPPCLNEGIRLLGSFCYCPPKYMGRYCEIYRFNSSCGRVPHGRWVYMNCNSCHCVAGVLKCQPHPMPGCDTQVEEHTTVSSPDLAMAENDDHHMVLQYNYNSATTRYHDMRTIISSLIAIVVIRHLLTRLSYR